MASSGAAQAQAGGTGRRRGEQRCSQAKLQCPVARRRVARRRPMTCGGGSRADQRPWRAHGALASRGRRKKNGSGRAAAEGRGGTSATRDTRNARVVRRCRGQFDLDDPGKISGRYILVAQLTIHESKPSQFPLSSSWRAQGSSPSSTEPPTKPEVPAPPRAGRGAFGGVESMELGLWRTGGQLLDRVKTSCSRPQR